MGRWFVGAVLCVLAVGVRGASPTVTPTITTVQWVRRGCGDGVLAVDEACDDGNRNNGDGCTEQCEIEQGWRCEGVLCRGVCGDGVLRGAEECDDGNLAREDGCSRECRLEGASWCNTTLVPSRCGSISYIVSPEVPRALELANVTVTIAVPTTAFPLSVRLSTNPDCSGSFAGAPQSMQHTSWLPPHEADTVYVCTALTGRAFSPLPTPFRVLPVQHRVVREGESMAQRPLLLHIVSPSLRFTSAPISIALSHRKDCTQRGALGTSGSAVVSSTMRAVLHPTTDGLAHPCLSINGSPWVRAEGEVVVYPSVAVELTLHTARVYQPSAADLFITSQGSSRDVVVSVDLQILGIISSPLTPSPPSIDSALEHIVPFRVEQCRRWTTERLACNVTLPPLHSWGVQLSYSLLRELPPSRTIINATAVANIQSSGAVVRTEASAAILRPKLAVDVFGSVDVPRCNGYGEEDCTTACLWEDGGWGKGMCRAIYTRYLLNITVANQNGVIADPVRLLLSLQGGESASHASSSGDMDCTVFPTGRGSCHLPSLTSPVSVQLVFLFPRTFNSSVTATVSSHASSPSAAWLASPPATHTTTFAHVAETVSTRPPFVVTPSSTPEDDALQWWVWVVIALALCACCALVVPCMRFFFRRRDAVLDVAVSFGGADGDIVMQVDRDCTVWGLRKLLSDEHRLEVQGLSLDGHQLDDSRKLASYHFPNPVRLSAILYSDSTLSIGSVEVIKTNPLEAAFAEGGIGHPRAS